MEARAAHILVNLVILSAGDVSLRETFCGVEGPYSCDALKISVGSSVRNIKLE
jgi:hypothetical protein